MDKDFKIQHKRGYYFFTPISDKAKTWWENNVEYDSWQMWGQSYAIEPNYANDLYEGIKWEFDNETIKA